jgi:GNAT superfamily N-acetyltransferase
MLPPAFSVRPARAEEAATYADFARDRFIATYAAHYEPARFARHVREAFGEAKQRAELADPHRTTLVAEGPAGEWAAFAVLCEGTAPSCVVATNPLELNRFYVHERWHGQGLARMLMDACDEWAAAGHDILWLCVFEENPRAERFYRKMGFVPVGNHPFVLGGVPDNDIVMARPVQPASAAAMRSR